MDLKEMKKIKINKDSFDLRKIKESAWNFLLNRFGSIFMSIFLITAIVGSFIIYKYMYNAEWSDAQKKEYRVQVEKSKPPFDIEKFDNVVKKIKKKNSSTSVDIEITKDIFGATE